MAATLTVGDGAALSYDAAAAVLEVGRSQAARSTSRSRGTCAAGGGSASTASPPSRAKTSRSTRNLPITTIERTLHDLAAARPIHDVARAAE